MLEERTATPTRLWRQVLETLLSTHKGCEVHSMGVRADQSRYRLGFWSDIEMKRSGCSNCNKISPSLAKLSPVEQCIDNYMSFISHQ